MPSNNEIIRKADLALSDLASDGGLLNPEQANTFIRKLRLQPTILRQARGVVMTAPQRKINKIGFGSRILRPAVSATALDASDRSKPTTEQVELNTKEVIAEIRLPYDVIEDNIERGNLNLRGPNADPDPISGGIKDTIVDLIAERAALDLEELALLGDTAVVGSDAYLGLLDGFLKQSTSNIVNVAGAPVSRTMFKNGLKTMPKEYLRNLTALRNFVSHNQHIEYRDSMAARETALGDQMVNGYPMTYAHGVPVEGAALMPETQGLLTPPLNMIWGIQRQVSIEVDKIITARVFVIVLTARVDFVFEEEEAVVKYNNIAV
jgi:hypothetical protein